jgi:hypothetical protein
MNSERTMIRRKVPSAPARWLYLNYPLAGEVINFGEGYAVYDTFLFNELSSVTRCVGYDPYSPVGHNIYPGPADMLVSIYVLNTLLPIRRALLFQEMKLLAPTVLIALRTDPVSGTLLHDGVQTQRGTFQKSYTAKSAQKDFGGTVIARKSGFLILEVR